MWPIVSRVFAYSALITLPLVATAATGKSDDPLILMIGTRFALLGYTIIALQFVLSARLRWIERPFGLDVVFRFHKAMGIFAGGLLLCHPLLVAAGDRDWSLLNSLRQPWPILLGKIALALLLTTVIVSLFRKALRFEFQKWLLTHNLVAGTILAVGFVHSNLLGDDLSPAPVRALWIWLAFLAAAAYGYHRGIVPRRLRHNAYTIAGVKQETHNAWTLTLTPPPGRERFSYLPGQFSFLTLFRAPGLPVEEHPFTISSSPTQPHLTFTIKASGDYTATIADTRPGDRAAVEGPYGRFSYALAPQSRGLVFVAGGIGITPLMSMLRHLCDTGVEAKVQLIYANRTEDDIVFRDELAALASAPGDRLRVTHVLDTPAPDWPGERGPVTAEMIRSLCQGDLSAKSFYLCAPPPMMKHLMAELLALQISPSQVYYELFSL